MGQKPQEPKTEEQKNEELKLLGNVIASVLEQENAFRLYSYRIIDAETFIQKIGEIAKRQQEWIQQP